MLPSSDFYLVPSRWHGLLRRGLAGLLLCLMAGLLAGCGAEKPPRVTMLLFDTSVSAGTKTMRARYTNIAKTVTRDLKGGDRIVAERITGASMQEAQLTVDVTVPPFDPLTSNQIKHEKAMRKAHATLKKGVSTLLGEEPSTCTDLFGALQLAGKVLQNVPTDATKRLLVASDMVETCGPNFNRRSLDSTATAALIEAQRESGRLPDLDGVRVWVAGATATEKLSPERVQAIERFWLRYFEATGANLTAARYGPTLLGWS